MRDKMLDWRYAILVQTICMIWQAEQPGLIPDVYQKKNQ